MNQPDQPTLRRATSGSDPSTFLGKLQESA